MTRAPSTPLGILAGGGHFPIELAEAVRATGRGVHFVALEGEADAAVESYPHTWVNWGGVGAMLSAFRRHGCEEIIIVGRVTRPNLRRLRPDLGFLKSLPSLIKMLKGGDDSVLRRVVRFFEGEGLRVCGVPDVAPQMVASPGPAGEISPNANDIRAIELGMRAVSALGVFDLGQAVVVGDGKVLSIEGAEGTDAMLRRFGEDRKRAGGSPSPGILVKCPKPSQEMRVDVPTIGPETVRLAGEVGLKGIAVAAGGVLIAGRDEVCCLIEKEKLFLCGMTQQAFRAEETLGDKREDGVGAEALRLRATLDPVGRLTPRALDEEDILCGLKLLVALRPFRAESAAVVSRQYVLAIENIGEAGRACDRAQKTKPWGMGFLKRRTGILIVDGPPFCDAQLSVALRRAGQAGLAGIVFIGRASGVDAVSRERVGALADEAGLFAMLAGA